MLKWLIFLLLITTPIESGALTLSTIRSACRLYARDDNTTRPRLTNTQLNGIINEGQRHIVQDLLPIVQEHSFPLVIGTTWYSLPSDYLLAYRVTRDYYVLFEKTPKALDKNSNWEEVSGLPNSYFVNFATRTRIGFYPWPGASSDTGTIRVEYFATATDLSSDSDQPFNGIQELQPYGDGLSYYCGFNAALLNGENDLASFYFQEYQLWKQLMDKTDKLRPSYNPSITPGSPTNVFQ